MIPKSALPQLGKQIARTLSGGAPASGLEDVGAILAADPDAAVDVIDLLTAESRKKKPNSTLIEAYGIMLGRTLEVWRYGVERRHAAAEASVQRVRDRVRALAADGTLASAPLMLVLRQFGTARLEPGADLQKAMSEAVEMEVAEAGVTALDIGDALMEMADAFDGDMFGFQAHLAEQSAAFPESQRAGFAAALMLTKAQSLWEAAIGWLLDPSAATRRDVAGLIQQAADEGRVSPEMLRRMIVMRNWIPDQDRQWIDAAIRTCRQKAIDCAAMPEVTVREVTASGIDGSGSQSIFIVVKDGRRQAVAGLLLQQGVGVRDAWVRSGLTKSEIGQFRAQIADQAACFQSNLDYVRLALGQALATSHESGTLPPFGLIDFVERGGLSGVNPQDIPVPDLVDRLIDATPDQTATGPKADASPEAVEDRTTDLPFMESWFEDDGAIDDELNRKRLSAKRRTDLVREKFLSLRRDRWASLLAWTAFTLRQDKACGDAWRAFASAARDLHDQRPLAEIPLMTWVAERTVEAWELRRQSENNW
ncbi:MAG: hypothetical protein F8N37_22715 [Telmatospirillum sp.]|nr:hypothetical protein [Telmatospirillum sp.]